MFNLLSIFPNIMPVIFGLLFAGSIILTIVIFVAVFLYAFNPNFRAKIDKNRIKKHRKYMDALGKDGYEDLQEMKEDYAGISNKAIRTNAKAFSEGWHAGVAGDDDEQLAAKTRKCSYCGHKVVDGSKFCNNCGKELNANKASLWEDF